MKWYLGGLCLFLALGVSGCGSDKATPENGAVVAPEHTIVSVGSNFDLTWTQTYDQGGLKLETLVAEIAMSSKTAIVSIDDKVNAMTGAVTTTAGLREYVLSFRCEELGIDHQIDVTWKFEDLTADSQSVLVDCLPTSEVIDGGLTNIDGGGGTDCPDATSGCSDPADDCGGVLSGGSAGCTGYETADIRKYTGTCENGDIKVVAEMASPIVIDPGSRNDRYQATTYLVSGPGGSEHQVIAISDDGNAFGVSGANPNGDSTSVDAQGNLVYTVTAETIAAFGAVASVRVDTYLSITGTYRYDETIDFPNPCL